MGQKEKLIERFKRLPKDFTYDETISLLCYLGYMKKDKGKTSGSRVQFRNETTGAYIDIHKPHPANVMKDWMMKAIYEHLVKQKYI